MKNIKDLTSACRYCRHYQPEGRRGGMCQQLGAPVQSNWKACSLSLPPFAPSWESLEDAWNLPDAKPLLTPDLNNTVITQIEEKITCISEEPKAKVKIS